MQCEYPSWCLHIFVCDSGSEYLLVYFYAYRSLSYAQRVGEIASLLHRCSLSLKEVAKYI